MIEEKLGSTAEWRDIYITLINEQTQLQPIIW